jgi:hypothetical protein
MELTSPAFEHEGRIPVKYTCDGDNINPSLEIASVPEAARSLALIMDDPDAPGGTFVHWTVWNIPAGTEIIEQDSVPEGAQEGMTSFGQSGYGGPCPPDGEHRYYFKLYALGGDIYLDPSATKEDLEKAMEPYILEQAELMGYYERQ